MVDSPPVSITCKAKRNCAIFKTGRSRGTRILCLTAGSGRRTAIAVAHCAGDRDFTFSRHTVYINCNSGRTVSNSGDIALRVHRGNGFVTAGISNIVGKGFFGGYGIGKLRRFLGLQGQRGVAQFDAFNRRQNRDLADSRKLRAVHSGGDIRFARRHGCDLARVADRHRRKKCK